VTFPELRNFRIVRVPGWRRVFAHAAAIFFERGIANAETKEFASLSAEYVGAEYPGFVAAAFDVDGLLRGEWNAFLEREEEFDLVNVPFVSDETNGTGVLCGRSSDEAYVARWGRDRFRRKYLPVTPTIWDWPADSGLRPCAVYLRHCVLAVTKAGPAALASFLDETYLCDRSTTVRDYLERHPDVMDTAPPPSLVGRYSG